MPRYKVTETRAFRNVYLVDADNEHDAAHGVGNVIEESPDADSYTESTDDVEQVDDEATL